MTPTPSPRHPWKALAVVLAMFAAVHGVRAHTGWHDHGFGHVHVVDSSDDDDCPDIDVRIDDGDVHIHGDDVRIYRGDPDDSPVIDVFDGQEWS